MRRLCFHGQYVEKQSIVDLFLIKTSFFTIGSHFTELSSIPAPTMASKAAAIAGAVVGTGADASEDWRDEKRLAMRCHPEPRRRRGTSQSQARVIEKQVACSDGHAQRNAEAIEHL
jgi:hypothetical protein